MLGRALKQGNYVHYSRLTLKQRVVERDLYKGAAMNKGLMEILAPIWLRERKLVNLRGEVQSFLYPTQRQVRVSFFSKLKGRKGALN